MWIVRKVEDQVEEQLYCQHCKHESEELYHVALHEEKLVLLVDNLEEEHEENDVA